MDKYFQTFALLGLHNGNLPPHHGMREKRYRSVEKMLDLLDVVKRVGPRFPLKAMFLNPSDPEWDDDMTYLQVEYPFYKNFLLYASLCSFLVLYNYNILFHNKNMAFFTKSFLGVMFFSCTMIYHKYRKQVLRCNLFDEYVQMRADELVKQREHLLRGEEVKKFVWYAADLKETLMRVHRQSYTNTAEDFKDSELLLQDFIRRYSDETEEIPLTTENSRVFL
jgi:hypothetical protein